MGYGNARQELHRVLSELCLPQVSLHSARASAATQAAEAGLEVNTLMGGGGWTGTSVMSYVRSERPLQRVQMALYNGLNGCSSTVVHGSHTHWLDTGSTWFCSAGSSWFSPAVRWENNSFSCSCCCCVIKLFRVGKNGFFILNTLSPHSRIMWLGGVLSLLWVHPPPPWQTFLKRAILVSLRGYYFLGTFVKSFMNWHIFC